MSVKFQNVQFYGKCPRYLYDPLGIVAPTVILFKIFYQELWFLRVNWDDGLPIDIFALAAICTGIMLFKRNFYTASYCIWSRFNWASPVCSCVFVTLWYSCLQPTKLLGWVPQRYYSIKNPSGSLKADFNTSTWTKWRITINETIENSSNFINSFY